MTARNSADRDDAASHEPRPGLSPPGMSRWSRTQIEHAIAEPLMTSDPLLSAVQASALLAVSLAHVEALTAAGVLQRHGPARAERRYRLSDLERVDTEAPVPQPPPGRRVRVRQRRLQARPGARISLREAARLVGLTEATLRRYYLDTDDLPRQPGNYRMIRRRDAYNLARHYANRLTIHEVADRIGYTPAGVRQLLRDGTLPRTPDRQRPVRADQLEQLLAGGWKPPTDPAHDGRVPTTEAVRILDVSRNEVTERARTGRVPAVRDRRGMWWFDPEHLRAIRQARRSEERGVYLPVARTGQGQR